ncbi:MAG: DUF1152 domain-containing protein, partial [Acidobacteriota bacterium]
MLLAGAGGGYDVFSGLPMLFWLEKHGVDVSLANLTFTDLGDVDEPWLLPGLKRVDKDSSFGGGYFPEKYLSQWFADRSPDEGKVRSIYCFAKTGVVPLRAAYREVMRLHDIDAVVLVDGGTDSLLRGDEDRLGTPHEDLLSIAAARGLEVDHKMLVSLGFGIDAYHGVCQPQRPEVAAVGGYGGDRLEHVGVAHPV